jgi:Arc/MetJ-type ribon-helix-helix transcriptional regulator
LFATSFRREADSEDRYQPNRLVVEHKGLLHSLWFRRGYLPSFDAVPLGTNSLHMCTFVHVVVTRLIRGGVRTVKSQAKVKTICRGLRIDEMLIGRIERAAKDGGFSNPSAFIRAAIERELAGRESGVDAAEERIAASLDRLAREIRRVKLGQQALFAFVDSLVKTLLTCIAEPPRDAYDQAVARGRVRYDRFLKSVGAGMAGDSHAAMTELLKRGEES